MLRKFAIAVAAAAALGIASMPNNVLAFGHGGRMGGWMRGGGFNRGFVGHGLGGVAGMAVWAVVGTEDGAVTADGV